MTTIETTLYFAHWCSHCIKFEPEWDKFASKIEKSEGAYKNLKIITKKYEESALQKENIDPTINGTKIRGFPTVKILVKKENGKSEEYEYDGRRDADSLFNHITVMAANRLA